MYAIIGFLLLGNVSLLFVCIILSYRVKRLEKHRDFYELHIEEVVIKILTQVAQNPERTTTQLRKGANLK